MSKKHLKKISIQRLIKTFKGRLFWTTLLTVSWLGGSDYQITTVIQLYASHHEAQNPTTLSKHHYS